MKHRATASTYLRQHAISKFCATAAAGLLWSSLALGQNPGSWQALADMPVGKWEPGTVVLDDKLYVFGGYTDGVVSSKRSEIFDPSDNSWTLIQELPSAITHMNMVLDGRIVWFAGGFKDCYRGHAIAAVAASSPHIAEEAIAPIEVDYEVLPAVFTAPDAMADDAVEEVMKISNGGVHHAIEAVGRQASADLCVKILRRGGTATILGMMPLDCKVGLGAMDLLSGKKLQGAIMGMNHFPVDLPRLVDFYMRGLLDLDTIIAERIPLEKINEGFEKMKQGTSARSVIVFD